MLISQYQLIWEERAQVALLRHHHVLPRTARIKGVMDLF